MFILLLESLSFVELWSISFSVETNCFWQTAHAEEVDTDDILLLDSFNHVVYDLTTHWNINNLYYNYDDILFEKVRFHLFNWITVVWLLTMQCSQTFTQWWKQKWLVVFRFGHLQRPIATKTKL